MYNKDTLEMTVVKHSKYKNAGLLFELLVRQIATDTMSNINSPAVKTLKKYPKLLNDNLILVNTAKAYPFVNMPKRSFSRYNIIHALAVRNLCNFLIRSREFGLF